MRRVLSLLALVIATTAFARADDPPKPAPAPKAGRQVKFPDLFDVKPVPVAPPPVAPKADPDAVVKIAPGQFYVVASQKPLLIIPTGPGEVTVVPRKAPFMLPASVAVGWKPDPTDPDFVTWGADYPYIYAVKPAKSGDVTLLILPATCEVDEKTKDQIPIQAKDVIRKNLQVDDGTAPRPPPKPVDPPTPKPVDPPTPKPEDPVVASGFRVLFVYESQDNLTQEQLNILNSTKIVAYLNGKCAKNEKGRPEWRQWDQNVDRKDELKKESALWQQMWKDAKPKLGKLPQVVIVNDRAGVTKAWPATEDAMLELLQQYGGK